MANQPSDEQHKGLDLHLQRITSALGGLIESAMVSLSALLLRNASLVLAAARETFVFSFAFLSADERRRPSGLRCVRRLRLPGPRVQFGEKQTNTLDALSAPRLGVNRLFLLALGAAASVCSFSFIPLAGFSPWPRTSTPRTLSAQKSFAPLNVTDSCCALPKKGGACARRGRRSSCLSNRRPLASATSTRPPRRRLFFSKKRARRHPRPKQRIPVYDSAKPSLQCLRVRLALSPTPLRRVRRQLLCFAWPRKRTSLP